MKAIVPENIDVLLRVTIGLTAKFIDQKIQKELSNKGLTHTQFEVLVILSKFGPCSVNDLIDKSLSSSGNLDVVITNLQKNGQVQKRIDGQDRRKRIIELTPEGLDIITCVLPVILDCLTNLFQHMLQPDKEELINLLTRLKNPCENHSAVPTSPPDTSS